MDYTKYLIAIAALFFVLALIGLISFLMKKYSGNFISIAKKPSERRLKVVEVLPIDSTRKIAILSRDGVEHTVLLAGNNAGGNLVLEKISNEEKLSRVE
jgi:flagellar protein FliO/FliZ